jgi:hypothetical protein
MQEEQHVKVLIRYNSLVLDKLVVETLWAIPLDRSAGLYRLDSIPFYGPPVASDDIFFAEYDQDEQALTFREVREPSGNSIIQVILMEEPYNSKILRGKFMELGCPSEAANERYFVVEVPASVKYEVVKEFLDNLQAAGQIDYAETILSDQHSS